MSEQDQALAAAAERYSSLCRQQRTAIVLHDTEALFELDHALDAACDEVCRLAEQRVAARRQDAVEQYRCVACERYFPGKPPYRDMSGWSVCDPCWNAAVARAFKEMGEAAS